MRATISWCAADSAGDAAQLVVGMPNCTATRRGRRRGVSTLGGALEGERERRSRVTRSGI
jgi:hypothetical protein